MENKLTKKEIIGIMETVFGMENISDVKISGADYIFYNSTNERIGKMPIKDFYTD